MRGLSQHARDHLLYVAPVALVAAVGLTWIVTLTQGSPARLAALDGVRAVEQDRSRDTLRSSDTDATVTALARSDLRWSGLEVGGPDLETSFLRLLGDPS